MKVVLSPEAAERLEAQVAFLRNAEAFDVAERLRVRVVGFLSNHLAHFPRTGRPLKDRDLWEMWVPRTRLVLWYRIEQEQIVVATVWHASQDRPMAKAMKKRVAILISGRGSNMMALVEAARAPGYPAEIVSIIASRPDAAGLAWAKAQGLPTVAIDHKSYATREAFDDAVHAALIEARADLIALAGFMRIQSAAFVQKWQGRQLNIHPSLLPLFKGLHPHQQALDAGVKISGCSVHFVTEEMDSGPIVAQAAVPVEEGDTVDTLASRILVAEHKLYPHALALVASGRASLNAGHVRLEAPANPQSGLFSPQL